MSRPYIAQDVLDQAAEAHRQGIPLARLASQLHCDVDYLTRLLGLPQWRTVPQDDANQEFDLFACDRLDGVL